MTVKEFVLAVNILVGIIYIVSLVTAYKHGFVYEMLNLLLSVASVAIGWFASPVLADQLTLIQPESFEDVLLRSLTPFLNIGLWFLIIVLVFRLVLTFIVPLFKGVSKVPVIGTLNRLMGLFAGALNATIWVILLAMFLALPVIPHGREIRSQSVLQPIASFSNQLLSEVSSRITVEEIGDEVQDLRETFKQWLEQQEFLND
ncbi:MAG: CvpA family protein [Erysipelotrichaceae bacterium]|nr:CvpA family protein [Erysipelotrichaceae bacterium]